MLRIKIYLAIVLFTNLIDSLQSSSSRYSNYCDATLCASNKRHIACGNKGKFGRSCTADAHVVQLNDYYKNLILHLHNSYRNQIASGDTPGFGPATRMGVLQWDNELAYLAELNAKTCEFEHDMCRNTRTFHFVGQNLALGWLTSDQTIEWAIRNFTTEWFIEYEDTPQYIIDGYKRLSGPSIGHFTLMTSDKLSRVGCGLVKYTKRVGTFNYKIHLFACNYSWANILEYPVYTRGAAASRCFTGNHNLYDGLCSEYERIEGGFY